MEFQKITNFLDTTSMIKIYQNLLLKNGLKFMIKQKNYSPNKEIRIKRLMLRSDLCSYSDAYVVMKVKIIVDKKHDVPIVLMCPIIQ